MKLVRFSTNGQVPRLGALQGDRIVDLTASVAATLAAARVAYETKNAAGERLIGEPVLNSVIVLLVVTSVLGPILTARFAKRLPVPPVESAPPQQEVRLGRGQEFEIILNELSGGAPFSDADRLITVDELERRYIERVLTLTSGNKSRAAH